MEQLLGILKEAEAGAKPAELCRRYGIAEQTFYRWRAKDGGMPVSDLKRLRQLEEENTRLKRLVAEQALDILALKAALAKKILTPAPWKEAVTTMKQASLSERRAWTLRGLGRSTYRYQRVKVDAQALRQRLRELAMARQRFGYRR
jgi:putative transposase